MRSSTASAALRPSEAGAGVSTSAPRRWHYTTGQRWLLIEQSGYIRPATAYVPKGEKPAVWFSSLPDWEPTATTMKADGSGRTPAEIDLHLGGHWRIEVAPETAPHSWDAYRRISGVIPRLADGLEAIARESGSAPQLWWVSFRPVPRHLWLTVEIRFRGEWVSAADTVELGDLSGQPG